MYRSRRLGTIEETVKRLKLFLREGRSDARVEATKGRDSKIHTRGKDNSRSRAKQFSTADRIGETKSKVEELRILAKWSWYRQLGEEIERKWKAVLREQILGHR